MLTFRKSIYATLISGVVLFGSGVAHAAADASIKQIRTNAAGNTKVIEFNTPAANAAVNGVAAGKSKASAIDKASQLLLQPAINAQIALGAKTSGNAPANEDFAVRTDVSTADTVRFQRRINAIPVYGEEAIVDFDANQNIRQLVSNASNSKLQAPASNAPSEGLIRTRVQLTMQGLFKSQQTAINKVQKFWVGNQQGEYALQYQVDISTPAVKGALAVPSKDSAAYRVWVDANSGQIIRYHSLEIDARDREIYDIHNQNSGNADLVKNETGNILPYTGGDSSIENLFNYLGLSYDFYAANYNRDSHDGNGAPINAIAHLGQGYNNAYWCGCDQAYFAFGDGDGVNFLPFSRSLHVVGHEFTHAVTQHTAALEYFGLSGALNESMSDMFGKLIEARSNNNVVPDWLVGKEIVTAQFGAPALRDMKKPHQNAVPYDQYYPFASSSQPEHLSEVYLGNADNGGVHINSSLTNKMLQLLIDGGTHRGVTVAALPIADVNKILYNTLSSYLTAKSDFYAFADGLKNACQVLASNLQTPAGVCINNVTAAAQAVGIRGDDLNFSVKLAGVKQISGNNNASIEAGEQFDLILDVFNKGTNLTSPLNINGVAANGAFSITPSSTTLGGNTSFGERQKITVRATALKDISQYTNIDLTFSASGKNSYQFPISVFHYGVFDPANFAFDIYNVPVAYDLNGDGIKELINIDALNEKLMIYNPITGLSKTTLLPRQSMYGYNFSAWQVAVDDFGMGDVRIVSTEDISRISTYNAQGTLLNSFTAPSTANWNAWATAAPIISDLDGDGNKEIIYTTPEALHVDPMTGTIDYTLTDRARVYVLDKNLNVKAGWPQFSTDVGSHGYPSLETAVGDLDGDGKKEIVLLNDYDLTVLDDQGRTKPGFPVRYGDMASNQHIALADVNGDGKLDIIFSNPNINSIFAYQYNGTLVAGFPIRVAAGIDVTRVIPVDLDGDGKLEFVVGSHQMATFARGSFGLSSNYKPAVISLTGQVLPGWPKEMSLYNPMIADITGDGKPDIVGGDSNGFLHAFNIQGQEVFGGSQAMNVANGWRNPVGAGVIGDFNNDGYTDMAYTEVGSNGYGFIQFSAPYNAASMVWPNPNRDSQNTNAPAIKGLPALNFRGTSNNWGLTPMVAGENGIWSTVVTITGAATDRFKLDASTNWTKAYGDTNKDGIAALGEADIYFNRPAGSYLIKFNDQTRGYSITKVAAPNAAPTANAGPDQNITSSVATSVTLNGGASSDSDGSIASYAWDELVNSVWQPVATVVNPTLSNVSVGQHRYRLTVTDNQGAKASDEVIVTIAAAGFTKVYNQVLVRGTNNAWAVTSPMSLVANNTWELVATFGSTTTERFKFDINGDWVTNFGDTNKDGIADAAGADIAISQGAGSYKIRFNDSSKAYTMVKQGGVNVAPTANAGPDQSITSSTATSVTLNGNGSSDSDGSIASYAWDELVGSTWQAVATGVNPTLSNVSVGQHRYRLTVTDNQGATATDEVIVTITAGSFTKVYNQVLLRGTNNAWGTTSTMALVANNTWEITVAFGSTTSERFKFDINGDWVTNFGDTNKDGTAEANGSDIAIIQGAGNYKIRFNDSSKVYSVVKQ